MLLLSLADWRDIIIIIYGVAGIIFFLLAIIVTAMVGFSVKGLISYVRGMLDETVKPALVSVRDAANTVRGTSEYVGRTAVTPIAKTYGAFAGVRRGLGILSGLNRSRGRR